MPEIRTPLPSAQPRSASGGPTRWESPPQGCTSAISSTSDSTKADKIEKATGFETRSVVLGHIQRGGSPSAYDRVLATRLGLHAAELVLEGHFGRMVALKGVKIIEAPLSDGVANLKNLDLEFYREASAFFQ